MLCLVGCGEEQESPASSAGAAGGASAGGAAGAASTGGVGGSAGMTDAENAASGGASSEQVDQAFRWLTGRFDSSDQAQADPTYFPIQLETCEVSAPELGERVLYVEQARMDALAQPYRQRLYVVDPEPEGTRVVSRVFELEEPTRWIAACAAKEPLTATPEDARERTGCAVHLEAQGDVLVGGTLGTECTSTLNGASYATSEVTLDAASLASWDRGFAESGAQVWGATAGPYVFTRRTELPEGNK
ncbi:MAG: chromophore lyase CpcT/CpeT [Polyangiaceae bacterium]